MKKNTKGKLFIDILYVVIVVAIIASVIAVSFAIFSYTNGTRSNNVIETGTLLVSLEEGTDVNLLDKYPISDENAKSYTPYTFTVHNNGTEKANYRISIVDDQDKYTDDGCTDKKMPWNKLRYSITKNDSIVKTADLDSTGILYTTILDGGEDDVYKLRVWINSNAGNEVEGLHFHSKMVIKAILENRTNYDTGA